MFAASPVLHQVPKLNTLAVIQRQLDQVFGFADRKKSSVKKLRQVFDEKTNEHVFIIEYRVLRGEHTDPRRQKEASIQRRVNQEKVNSLLRDINDRATLGFPQTG